MRPPRLSVTLSNLHRSFGPDLRAMIELARLADEAGIDQVALSDHVLMGEHTERYPYGKFPFAPDEPWMEPLTTLAAIASVTRRVRLATGILIVPLRPAALLAKTVATLDVLSEGRVDLGVGVGWQREEYDAIGVPFEERWQRLTDTIGACRALWRDVPATFASKSVQFERAYGTPVPVQPRIPVWLGAKLTERHARWIAELGDGWFPLATTPPAEIAIGARVLRQAFVAAGRDPDIAAVRAGLPVRRRDDGTPDVAAMVAAAAELEGATIFAVPMAGIRSLEAARRYFEDIVSAFRGHAPNV